MCANICECLPAKPNPSQPKRPLHFSVPVAGTPRESPLLQGTLQLRGFRQPARGGVPRSAAPQPSPWPACPAPGRGSGPHTLTLLLKGRGVQLQVVQTKAGPGQAPQVPELRSACSAAQPHRAAVVLGDDGTSAAACGGASQGRPGLPPSLPSHEGRGCPSPSQNPETSLYKRPQAPLGSQEPIFIPVTTLESFLEPSQAAWVCTGPRGRS